MIKVNRFSMMLFSALLAVGMLSCSKEEAIDTKGKTPIAFHCMNVQTKAQISSADDMKADGFGVYAHATFEKDGAALSDAVYSFNRTVNFSETEGWNYTNPEYWLPNGSYTFRAYYPADFPATISETSKTEYSFTGYEIASQYGTQTDILMATDNRKTSEVAEKGTKVLFSFNHLLSNVNLKLKVNTTEREKVDENGEPVVDSNGNNVMETIPELDADIRAMAFTGVAQKADYVNGSWTNHSGTTAVGDNLSTAIRVTPEGVLIFDEGLLTIPRTIDNGTVRVYILADITLPNGTTMEKEWNLTVPAITWNPGVKYTYTATLTAEFNIEFSEPEVETWGEDPMSGTVIIR